MKPFFLIYIYIYISILGYLTIYKQTFQSETYGNSWSNLSIDGDVNTCSIAGDGLQSTSQAWWRAELNGIFIITTVVMQNTPGTSC